jgi:hypothetical protein
VPNRNTGRYHTLLGRGRGFRGDRTKRKFKVRLGVPKDHWSLINAPELDYSSFYVTTGMGTPAACRAGFSLADQGSHSHPRGDFAPYRALFSVSCAHPRRDRFGARRGKVFSPLRKLVNAGIKTNDHKILAEPERNRLDIRKELRTSVPRASRAGAKLSDGRPFF